MSAIGYIFHTFVQFWSQYPISPAPRINYLWQQVHYTLYPLCIAGRGSCERRRRAVRGGRGRHRRRRRRRGHRHRNWQQLRDCWSHSWSQAPQGDHTCIPNSVIYIRTSRPRTRQLMNFNTGASRVEEEEEKEDFVTKPFYYWETFRNDEEHINFTVLQQQPQHPKTMVKFVDSRAFINLHWFLLVRSQNMLLRWQIRVSYTWALLWLFPNGLLADEEYPARLQFNLK